MTSSDTETTRLNKHLALQLGISRREADTLIEQGSIKINDTVATLGARFTPADVIFINGKRLKKDAALRYIILNKPIGYVCSRKAQGDSPTIYSLLPKDFFAFKPVGRLDRDSSGLILLTNDGDFAFEMTHPKFRKKKVYNVVLDKELEPLHQQMISDFGVQLEDGKSQLTLGRLSDTNRREWEVTMSEGRNRQIRRTFTALGYTVTRLHRTHFGPYELNRIKPGAFVEVDKK
jgi:23S rRNA pseudouridine2605 synthase